MPRPKKPLEQHIVDGTYRPSIHGPLPPKLESWRQGEGDAPGLPEKPADLSAAATVMWEQVLRTRPGTIWPSDAVMLAVYCEWWSIWKEALLLAQLRPSTKTLTPLGIITDKLDKLGAKFGLSPKDRAALPVVQSGPKKAQVETRPSDIDDHLKSPGRSKARKKRKGV